MSHNKPRPRLFRRQKPRRTEVFSYYANRAQNLDSRDRAPLGEKSASKSWLVKLPSFIAGLALVISIGYSLSLTTTPKIILATTDPQAQSFLRDPAQYQRQAQAVLSSSLWNRTKITLDTQAVATKLQSAFPELAGAAVSVPLVNRRPLIELAPAQPALLLVSQGTTYVIDFKGRAIMKTTDAVHLQTNDLPVVTDQSGLPLAVGKTVLLSDNIVFIRDLSGQLHAKGQTVQSLILPPLPNELHLQLAGQPYFVKFDLLGDARQQAGTLLAVKAKLEADHVAPSQYIDVRVEERAYYK